MVKMADVARRLGVSKATVSLAVNGKSGVNEGTRKRILECIKEMEQSQSKGELEIRKVIKVIAFNRGKQVMYDPEMDLWSGVLDTFDRESRRHNYLFSITYLNKAEYNIDEIIEECNQDLVAGVILFGTEMAEEDRTICDRIKKAVVLYDYEMQDGSYSSVCIDHYLTMKMACDYLLKKGAERIKYLANSKDIYNFRQRRKKFHMIMMENEKIVRKNDIVFLGNNISEITQNAKTYFQEYGIPEAFVMENYQVSVGVLTALQMLKIKNIDKIKMIGVDEIPSYVMLDKASLAQIKIPHIERAAAAVEILIWEIEMSWTTKKRVLMAPKLLPCTED